MSVSESLGAVIKAHPTTRLVAFADLSSSMILASQGSQEMTQEHLDRLCRQARAAFDDPLFALSVEAFSEPHCAVVMDRQGLRIFVRSEIEPADALCCICEKGTDVAALLSTARETLDQLSNGS